MQPTLKESLRYAQKANRRARKWGPSIEDFEQAARLGDTRLTEALIARYTIRMDNLPDIPSDYLMAVLETITCLLALDKALVRLEIPFRRAPAIYYGHAPRHLAWGVDSMVAACRLLLCGQIAGAAVVARQQLEHWTMFLSKASGVERGDSSIDQFIARCWDPFISQLAAGSDVGADTLGDVVVDDSPLEDKASDQVEAADGDVEVALDDGTLVCPRVVYTELSELLHANLGQQAVRWEAVDYLAADQCTAEVIDTAKAVVHALQLCLIQIHFIVGALVKDRDPALATLVLATMPAYGHRTHSSVPWKGTTPLPTLKESVPVAQLVSPDIAALMPLTPDEGLCTGAVGYLAERSRLYEAVVAGDRPEGRLYRNDELASLAFAARRYASVLTAQHALAAESDLFGDDFDVRTLTGRGARHVIVAEVAALLSRWAHARPTLAASAALVSSTLRSALWLWLEDDDRAMATLRCTLEQTARMRACHVKPDKAAQLAARSATMPRDWLDTAGWRRLGALNRALSEYAHAHKNSRWAGARHLLTILQVEPGDNPLLTARGAALNFVTTLVAREAIRVIGDGYSAVIATALPEALARWGLEVDLDDASLNRELDHIWSHRQTSLGPVSLQWN